MAEAFSEYTVIAAGKLVQELNGMEKEKTYSYVEGVADPYGIRILQIGKCRSL